MSQLRKVNLPLDSSAKVVGPRLLHGSQWGIIDPVDTPDGGNVGLHKHMAIGAIVTDGYSKYQLIPILRKLKMKFLQESYPKEMYYLTKIIIKGNKFYEVPINYNGRNTAEGKKIRFYHFFPVLFQILLGRFR